MIGPQELRRKATLAVDPFQGALMGLSNLFEFGCKGVANSAGRTVLDSHAECVVCTTHYALW
jgi:hypothetical protein